jgi:hypothetical protein
VLREANKLTEGLTLEDAPEMMMIAGHIVEVCSFLQEDGSDHVPASVYELMEQLRRLAAQANQKKASEAKSANHGLDEAIRTVLKEHPRWVTRRSGVSPLVADALVHKGVMQVDDRTGKYFFRRADDRRAGRERWQPIGRNDFEKRVSAERKALKPSR